RVRGLAQQPGEVRGDLHRAVLEVLVAPRMHPAGHDLVDHVAGELQLPAEVLVDRGRVGGGELVDRRGGLYPGRVAVAGGCGEAAVDPPGDDAVLAPQLGEEG